MIRLFRKIRHKLLSESSYGMYVLYASGEVLLVVVGIILALQLDNWHSQKVEKDILASHLATVLENLEDDRTRLIRLRQDRGESGRLSTIVIDKYRAGKVKDSQTEVDFQWLIEKYGAVKGLFLRNEFVMINVVKIYERSIAKGQELTEEINTYLEK